MSESELVELLTNNDSPSDEAVRKVEQLLVDPLREISGLESRIAILKAEYSKYQTIISPFRRIPNDMLQEIFYHCVPNHRNPFLSASEAPVLLTRVCSRWRAVALSSPRLWAQMHIPFSDDSRRIRVSDSGSVQESDGDEGEREGEKFERAHTLQVLKLRTQVVHEWLERSGSCPLSISIFYSSVIFPNGTVHSTGTKIGDPTTLLFQIITRSLCRIVRLEINIPLEIYHELDDMIIKTDLANSLSGLKSLNVNFHHQYHPSAGAGTEPKRLTLLKAPHLERLSLTGLGPALTFSDLSRTIFSSFQPRGESLTRLSSNLLLTAPENFNILTHCHNLLHCKISVTSRLEASQGSSSSYETLSNAVVSLPHLLSLSIWEGVEIHLDLTIISQLYGSINAPQLTWINYENQPYIDTFREMSPASGNDSTISGPQPTSPIIPLLQRSTQLKKLSLEPRYFLPSDLRKALEIVSLTLTHLVLGQEASLRQLPNEHRAPLPDPTNIGLLEWLLVDSTSASTTILLPHLKVFELSIGIDSDKRLFRFIKSRLTASSLKQVAPLRIVRVMFNRKKQLDIKHEVTSFLESVSKGTTGTSSTSEARNPVIKLDLDYISQIPAFLNPLSASYGVDQSNKYWSYTEINESFMPE